MDQEASSTLAHQQPTPNSSASDDHNQSSAEGAKPLASCDLCRKRKVKCDRGKPCSNCLRSGVACVFSIPSRVPRTRTVGRRKPGGEISKRIAKLENLVKYLEAENSKILSTVPVTNKGDAHPSSDAAVLADSSERQLEGLEATRSSSKHRLDRYLSSSFWVALSDEINGLREVLDDPSDESEGEDSMQHLHQSIPTPMQGSSPSFAIFQSDALLGSESPLEHPTPLQIRSLCLIYLSNVDCVFKVLHAPSLEKYLLGQGKDLDCSPGPGGLEALKFAIYYAATTTLNAEQCIKQLGEEKSTLLIRYRSSIELALARADFVNTLALSTLQALVIFLVSVRSNDATRFSWTVLSLAIRIATALGLHREESFASLRPFHKEMRRRLWWQIFALDEQGAQDRGSDPIITKSSYNTKKPTHVDDNDLKPEDVEEPRERESFTDMTFCSIVHEVIETMIQLNFVPAGEPELAPDDVFSVWEQRRDFVIRTQHRIQDKYLRYCDLTIPFQYLTKSIADIIMAQMWLILYRPLQKRAEYSSSFQPTNPNILRLSIEVLEKSHSAVTNPAAENTSWLGRNYSAWHALAVTLAELCVQTEGPTVERAWAIVEATIVRTEQIIADSHTGMLWAPIKRLARRARNARQYRLQAVSAGPAAEPLIFASKQSPTPGTMDDGLGAMGIQPATVPQQDMSLASAETFDWSSLFQGSGSEFELGATNTNPVAWANWEGFVDDLHGPGDMMQGQEYGFTPPFGSWVPEF